MQLPCVAAIYSFLKHNIMIQFIRNLWRDLFGGNDHNTNREIITDDMEAL